MKKVAVQKLFMSFFKNQLTPLKHFISSNLTVKHFAVDVVWFFFNSFALLVDEIVSEVARLNENDKILLFSV